MDENTLDYLPPSTELANQYLLKMKKDKWISYVDEIIINHHKLTAYKNTSFPLVEVFRKADSIDLSKGLIHFGLNKEFIKKVNTSFPNSGFHNFLFHFSLKWILKNPLNPAPIFKW
ncbi:MAG: hypothetical protein KDK54_18010 [Leptospiraceae bacterium]|nr:hypothetical protein [Leptospiraceae bacterium]